MRRLDLVPVTVYCPHYQRPVAATHNRAVERLVHCAERDACRATDSASSDGAPRPYPRGCPVYPSLTSTR